MKLFLYSVRLLIAIADYVRLSDQHYALHFPEISETDLRTIPAEDNRFCQVSTSEDYAIMSWV